MKLSIITPVNNDPRIKDCLESVRRQIGDFELEHIVVDSLSDDETVEVLDAYQDHIDSLIREPDDGVFEAMNKGLTRATGDIVGILNADDRYQDDSVLKDVSQTMAETGVDACYGDLVYVNDEDEVVRYWHSGPYKSHKFYYGWMPPHPTFFVRRELYDQYGLFDLTLPIAADYELMLRFLFIHGVSVGYVDRVLVRMAIGGQSNASILNMSRAINDMYRAWAKHQLSGRFIAPFLHPLEKVPQYVRAYPKDRDAMVPEL